MRKHITALMIAVYVLTLPFGAFASIDTRSSRYAAFVIDADTGEVFYARNADVRRYPASLTKMMTLYLTYEALKSGKISLSTRLPVSARAASQPQTNISLRAGQSIKVDDAIKALVVRSANDVAVVMAEGIGGTESNFAQMMTRKARALGMNNTQYRNPHGLPDRQQYTTARDQAKLSVALRRDHPQYYHYFKTASFTWGKTVYTSHNRVLGRFKGADGIKTGFINMSGFNVATSVKRDGYNVVSVVLGGQTAQVRDDHAVSLLDRAFTQLAERGDQPRAFASAAPVPETKPTAHTVTLAEALPWKKPAAAKPASPVEQPSVIAASPAPVVMANVRTPEPKPVIAATVKPAVAATPVAKPALSTAAINPAIRTSAQPITPGTTSFRFNPTPASSGGTTKNTLNFQLASLSQPQQQSVSDQWGIQVGAFGDEQSAMTAATQAMSVAGDFLKGSVVNITDRDQASVHRARLNNLTEYQAKKACQRLSQHNSPCFVFRSDLQQNL